MIGRDTIFALSSAAGRAGVAVVRVSGPLAGECLRCVFGKLPEPRFAQYGALKDPVSGDVLDRGIVLWFPGPQSATGEDCAEFHVHGSRGVIAGLSECLAGIDGCRPAVAGEFIRRAFVAGKLDLVEVEGLADLLDAETAAQRRLALRQAGGQASHVFDGWRKQLVSALAEVEARVDFGDEDDIASLRAGRWRTTVAGLITDMGAELERGSRAVAVRRGAKVVLAGVPNTGKSSILNALARRDVAIVSAQPGTTRDTLEVPLDIGGFLVTLTDTAGLRETDNEIELAGVKRTAREIDEAEVVVWVCAKDIVGSAEHAVRLQADIVVENKADMIGESQSGLNRNESTLVVLQVSARDETGLDLLLETMARLLRERYGQGEDGLLSRARQLQAVKESIRYLNGALGRQDDAIELLAEDLRRAATALGRLTGIIDVEDLLDSIFGEFCIGK